MSAAEALEHMPGTRCTEEETLMRTVSIFRNNRNQAIRLPKDSSSKG
jgi:hypothetical protein